METSKIGIIPVKIQLYLETCTWNKNEIKDQWIHNLTEVVIEGLEVDIIEKIKIAKDKDKEIVRIVKEIKKAGVKALQGEK